MKYIRGPLYVAGLLIAGMILMRICDYIPLEAASIIVNILINILLICIGSVIILWLYKLIKSDRR